MSVRPRLAAITIDYETWQPIPSGKRIDWQQDVFAPADRLMEMGEACGVPITFMAEMGEYFWLVENDRGLAQRMVEQWQEAVLRGHDVQLHLHTSWLPELGARCGGERWSWDFSRAKADDYPGDLAALIGRCKQALEEPLQRIDPEYRAIAFRAGTYQVQPFRRLFDALVEHGIVADTSVFAGGHSAERGYDFRLAKHPHQPWFANPFDPQLIAAPAEQQLLEIPVTTFAPGERWFLDNAEGPQLARRFETWQAAGPSGSPSGLGRVLSWLRPGSRRSQAAGPQAGEPLAASAASGLERSYFVIIGHTKAELHTDAIAACLIRLREQHGIESASLAALARTAYGDLTHAPQVAAADAARPRAVAAAKSTSSTRRCEQLPLDRTRLLDLETSGALARELATSRPWASVSTAADPNLCDLEFAGHSFDSVCVGPALRETDDPTQALRELQRVLADGGLLLATLPAPDSSRSAVMPTGWQPAEHELRMRLAHAGFVDVAIEPHAAGSDPVWLIHGWKRARPADPLDRACEMMDWIYRMIEPAPIPEQEFTPDEILRLGRGLCLAYAVVLLSMLHSEGYSAEWLTMVAEDHPRGRGPERRDSHEVVVLHTQRGDVLLDPMANLVIPHSLEAVLQDPRLAVPSSDPDERYRSRGYELYTTQEWYGRVTEYWLRKHQRDRIRKQRVPRSRKHQRKAA
jgi:SAM-dependent methyltransferase